MCMVLAELSYFYRQLCAKNRGRDDIEVGEGDISTSLQDGENFSSQGFQSNATSPYTSYI
jgi:hypothetical protein